MEKRRRPGMNPGCGWAHAGKHRCEPCGCDHGYIVEKIISNRRCETCFDGTMTLCGLPEHLHGPLTLCSVEVIQVKPAKEPGELPPTAMRMPPCGFTPCAHSACDRVVIMLLCCVADSCGRRAEGVAQIEIDDCCGPLRREERGANVRRGAQVILRDACLSGPCAFHVYLDICLHTVISCCEMVSSRPCNPCPDLPLYPPPCRPGRC